jgi:hypothetical protein
MIREHVGEMQRRESQHCQVDFGFPFWELKFFVSFKFLEQGLKEKTLFKLWFFEIFKFFLKKSLKVNSYSLVENLNQNL